MHLASRWKDCSIRGKARKKRGRGLVRVEMGRIVVDRSFRFFRGCTMVERGKRREIP